MMVCTDGKINTPLHVMKGQSVYSDVEAAASLHD